MLMSLGQQLWFAEEPTWFWSPNSWAMPASRPLANTACPPRKTRRTRSTCSPLTTDQTGHRQPKINPWPVLHVSRSSPRLVRRRQQMMAQARLRNASWMSSRTSTASPSQRSTRSSASAWPGNSRCAGHRAAPTFCCRSAHASSTTSSPAIFTAGTPASTRRRTRGARGVASPTFVPRSKTTRNVGVTIKITLCGCAAETLLQRSFSARPQPVHIAPKGGSRRPETRPGQEPRKINIRQKSERTGEPR